MSLKQVVWLENEDIYDRMRVEVEGYYVEEFMEAIKKATKTITSHGYTNNWRIIEP